MIPYVFLASMPHSGSTLIAFLMNAHPDVFSLGETWRIHEMLPQRWEKKNDLCSCGRKFYDCEFWNPALAGMAARGYGLSDPDFFRFEDGQEAVAHEKLRAFAVASLDVSGKRVFFDAGKRIFCIPPLLSSPYLDLRFINLTRDGRGIINSWRRNLPDVTLDKLIQQWVHREDKRVETFRGIASDRVLDVKYEDVAENPREALRRIFAFIGVDPEVDTTSGYKSACDHHIIGNQMRLSPDETIRFDEKWRTALSADDLDLFDRLGGRAVNERNGYSG